jgi:hypothetical protein
VRRVPFAFAISSLLVWAAPAATQTPSWSPPADSARCPSKWGAGDERGAGNHMKPQIVLNAIKLIKTGDVVELAWPLNCRDAVRWPPAQAVRRAT